MKYLKLPLVLVITLFTTVAFAQAVAAPTYLDAILAWISGNAGMVASIVAVLEVILRLVPTSKAMSLLVPAKYLLASLGAILSFVAGSILDPLIKSGNNVSSLK